jgi:L,D-transpeptidase YcbB
MGGGLRYERILAGTALALVLAAPFGAYAQAPAEAAKPAAEDRVKPPALGESIPKPPAPPEQDAATPPAAAQPAVVAQPPAAAAAPAAAAQPPAAAAQPPAAAQAPAEPAADAKAAAAEPPVVVDPLASLDPADRPIAEKIRDLFAAKSDKIFASKKERAAIEAFYKNRNLAPLWLDKGVENARAKAVIARVKAADADGLDLNDYKLPDLAASEPDALAEAELKLTQTVITFARHLQAGRFPYTRISHNSIELPQAPPDMAAVLTKLADAKDAAAALDEFSPPHAAYKALKAKLAELRGATGEEQKIVRIPDGPMVRPGMEDERMPLLRKRLKLGGDGSNLRLDDELVAALKAFQKSAGLNPDGVLGPNTLRHLNNHVAPRRADNINTIIANMERWRWYARDLGKAYSMVNQPDFTLKVVNEGKTVWTTRVVIGKPDMKTPLLSETMKYITINPTWNVPPSIVQNEYLPALAQDPTVLARMGLKVVYNRDGSVHIYQPPGADNALGRIRFNFPNRFLVYQHDTPDKPLFAHEVRAYSHGCMRVQDPAKYAEVLLGIARPGDHYSQERIKKMYGSAEQDIQLPPGSIWVHLTYQTAFVDDDGKLQIRRDIYGLDGRMFAALKSERGIVEPVQDRPKEVSSNSGARRAAPQRQLSFFEMLFGGGRSERPSPPRRVRR